MGHRPFGLFPEIHPMAMTVFAKKCIGQFPLVKLGPELYAAGFQDKGDGGGL